MPGGGGGGSCHSTMFSLMQAKNADMVLPLQFLSFHLNQVGASHRERKREGMEQQGTTRGGGYFWGHSRAHGLSKVRPKDSITACPCPSCQGNIPKAYWAQLMTCEQRLSLTCTGSLGLFLLLQAFRAAPDLLVH